MSHLPVHRSISPILLILGLLVVSLSGISRPAAAQTDAPKPSPEVAALLAQGLQASRASKSAEGIRLFNLALERAHQLNDVVGEAYVLTYLGAQYYDDRKFDVAAPLLEKALQFLQNRRNKPLQIIVLLVLAQDYKELKQPDKALDCAQQVVALCQETADEPNKMKALLFMGLIYVDKQQWAQVIDSFEPTLPYVEKSGNKDGLSAVLGMLSFGYMEAGQYLKAIEYCEKTLQIREGVTNRRGEALALMTLAALYVDLGEYQQSRDNAAQAIKLSRELGMTELTILLELILAENYRRQQQFQAALDYSLQSLPLLRKVDGNVGLGLCLMTIGGAYRGLGQSAKALPYYEEAARFFHAAGNLEWEGETLDSLGQVCLAIGKKPRAGAYFKRALTVLNLALTSPGVAGNHVEEAAILYYMSIAEEEEGQLLEARTHLAQAVASEERFRASFGDLNGAKLKFLQRILFGYHRAIAVMLRAKQPDEAFAVVQKTKARVLLDLMTGGNVDIKQSLTEEQSRHELDLRQEADKLNLAMVRESVNNEVGAKKRFEALKEQLARTERDLQTYDDSLYAQHPQLAGKRVATTATLEDVGRFLPEDTVLLEFATLYAKEFPDMSGADQTQLFVVTKENGAASLRVTPVAVSRDALAQEVEAFRSACADPRKAYQVEARKLYDLLIRPIASVLAGKKRLLICPDGPLWGLPFAALYDGKQYLLQSYEIAYAYSATGALAAQNQQKHNRPEKTLLALGNPDFGQDRFGDNKDIPGQRPIAAPSRKIVKPTRPIAAPSRKADDPTRPIAAPSRGKIPDPSRPIAAPSRGGITAPVRPIAAPSRAILLPRGGHITMLPGTQRELDLLHKQFPDATIFSGAAAQESIVKQTAGQYRYVHLASHAFFNDAAPLLSSIVLAKPPSDSADDGFLTARELFDMNLQADMVVLSACNTARGDKRSGEGIVGLTWALFVAGASTQVVSQWTVDDACTATLMGTFYANLAQGKAAALRTAELSLLHDRQHAHPYYWAPFTLMGDWR